MKTPETTACPDIGQMLKNRIKRRRISKAALSRNANRKPQNLQKILGKPSIQIRILWELCVAMRHNFFMDLAAQLPAHFTTNAPDPTLPLQERIAALEEENKLLKTKVETLMQVIGK